MTPLMCYEFTCGVCGVLPVWSNSVPTECPDDANHDCSGIMQSSAPVGMSMEQIHLHDDAGRVFRVTVDQNGTMSAEQVSGPAPA